MIVDIMEMGPPLLTAIGALAAAVSIVTQLTKNLGWLARIPTDAQVLVTSLLLSLGAAFAWAEANGGGLTWYLPLGAAVAGLLAAFIAMYGWATFYDLLERFTPPGAGGECHE